MGRGKFKVSLLPRLQSLDKWPCLWDTQWNSWINSLSTAQDLAKSIRDLVIHKANSITPKYICYSRRDPRGLRARLQGWPCHWPAKQPSLHKSANLGQVQRLRASCLRNIGHGVAVWLVRGWLCLKNKGGVFSQLWQWLGKTETA